MRTLRQTFAAASCAAIIAGFSAGAAFAGEITGSGKPTAGPDEDALICFPTRVVATPAGGSAYTFTMFQAPGQSDEQFEDQHASLLREFENLKRRFGELPAA